MAAATSSLALLPAYQETLRDSTTRHVRVRPRCAMGLGTGLELTSDTAEKDGVEVARTTRCARCGAVLAHVRRGLTAVPR